ncbi:DUF2919 family protein [Enterobacteriaceae bacterium RIT691]|nr:DUF2919 family protein [Enterobacteriaceae bacterium RIT691]
MKNIDFPLSVYDPHGRLKLPFLFWCVLLLQARTWVLFVMAAASRQQGDTLLTLFYPDHDNFWLGLLPGIPAVIAFLISGRRDKLPRCWALIRWGLIVAQLILLLWQPLLWLQGDELSGPGVTLVVLDAFALCWLLTNRRLRACFLPHED